MKPLIGINLDISEGPPRKVWIYESYVECVEKAGGIPILLPPMSDQDLDRVIDKLSGIMLIGGPDYCPSKYGEKQAESVKLMDQHREDFDFRLIKKALNYYNMPILGICAGTQLLNISLGGSLIQDIDSELPDSTVEHRWTNPQSNDYTFHGVKLEPGTKLVEIYKTANLNVPTSHHQAVKTIGKGLKVAAHADDGIIEALELPDRPFVVGVQWHPERDFEHNKNLFQSFVEASATAKVAH